MCARVCGVCEGVWCVRGCVVGARVRSVCEGVYILCIVVLYSMK